MDATDKINNLEKKLIYYIKITKGYLLQTLIMII